LIEEAVKARGMGFLGYREVPVNPEGVGVTSLSVEPTVIQFFVSRPEGMDSISDFERKLYILRALIEREVGKQFGKSHPFYIASLSCQTLVYKGQLTTSQVRSYYPDLSDERFISAFGLVHSRFSTNTFPSWKLAQPFRMLAHNGEINTLTGNLNWFYAGLRSLASPYFSAEEIKILSPVVGDNQSDSACLDNVAELLLHSGRSLAHVLLMMVPEAWEGN